MLIFYVLSLVLALEDLSSIKDIDIWSQQHDVRILGLFKEPVDSSKESLFIDTVDLFESSKCGLSFGLTKVNKAWDRYKLPENRTSEIVIHGNYNMEDGDWTSDGSAVIIFDSEWNQPRLVKWITTWSFPPAVDIWHLMNGGTDAQHRARFLLGVDMPKIMWLHDGLNTPAFFVGIGEHLREKIIFLVYDNSENEISDELIDGGWSLTVGVEPLDPSKMWGEYEGELNEKGVKEWVDEVVIKDYFETYIEHLRDGQTKKIKVNRKKKKKKKKRQKKKKSKKDL